MNSVERRDLRDALVKQGFVRKYVSTDHGDGAYDEKWERPSADPAEIADTVRVEWGKDGFRTP